MRSRQVTSAAHPCPKPVRRADPGQRSVQAHPPTTSCAGPRHGTKEQKIGRLEDERSQTDEPGGPLAPGARPALSLAGEWATTALRSFCQLPSPASPRAINPSAGSGFGIGMFAWLAPSPRRRFTREDGHRSVLQAPSARESSLAIVAPILRCTLRAKTSSNGTSFTPAAWSSVLGRHETLATKAVSNGTDPFSGTASCRARR